MGKKNKNLFDECNHCGEQTPISKETAFVVNFTRCFGNFVMNTCVECGGKTRLFIDERSQAYYEKQGIEPVDVDIIPEPDFIEAYLRINNIPLPEEHELTEEQELAVANWGGYLAVATVTEEDFE